MTVAEMCVVGKPAIFVPFPFAAEDHQTVNAQVLVNKKAALMIPDAKVKSDLFPCLLDLIRNETLMKELAENISKLGNTKADEVIAEEILEKIEKE